jgi:uncharacterized RDD family membrane protein YckC
MTEANPYSTPEAASPARPESGTGDFEYLGFWKRVLASIVDNLIVGVVFVPIGIVLLAVISDRQAAEITDTGIRMVVPALAIVLLWTYFGATPGKMIFGAKIVDAKTFKNPSLGKSIVRYIGYIPSTLLLFGGYIMVAFDKKKRGLHDVMAGTLVVVPKRRYTRRPARRPQPGEPAPQPDSPSQGQP